MMPAACAPVNGRLRIAERGVADVEREFGRMDTPTVDRPVKLAIIDSEPPSSPMRCARGEAKADAMLL